MDCCSTESLAQVRHELRTPVNHIIGYSELLIEDASARHLEAYVPVFEKLQNCGRELLQSIQNNLSERTSSSEAVDLRTLNLNIRDAAAEMLETADSLVQSLDYGHRQTLADVDAISWALRRLLEFACGDVRPAVAHSQPVVVSDRETLGAHTKVEKRKGRILIADDEARNRELLRRRLESEGHSVLEAESGLQALALLREHETDLILLDIMMPDLNGFQTLAKLKADPRLCELPVIMISALDDMGSVVRCVEMGADDYLPKPFNRVLLRARIGASLEKKWLRDGERQKTTELEQALRLLEHAQVQLSLQATHDTLTGLSNRRSVDSRLESFAKNGTPFSAFYIDLNGFKGINDTYGHQAGDELLKQVGNRLRLAFRATDLIGRWGGDEFVAVVQTHLIDTQVQMARIKKQFAEPFLLSCLPIAQPVTIGAAVGVANWRAGDSITEVLQRADANMYERKAEKPRSLKPT